MSKGQLANGIAITPMPPANGNPATIEYSGALSSSGSITLCLAYGNTPENRFSHQEIPMQKHGSTWNTTFTISTSDQLNLSFKDQEGKIDDNQGRYYSVPVNSDYMSYA